MADEAKRDAKLTLKFETAEAVKGMKEVERAGAKVAEQQKEIASEAGKATKAIQDQGRAAEAAAKTIERYGAETLAVPESRSARAAARSLDRKHDAAQRNVDEYRLNKHYEGIRKQRADQEAASRKAESFQADNNRVHDDAQKRLDDYRLAKHYTTERQKRADLADFREAEVAERASEAARHSRARDGRFSDRIAVHMAGIGGMSTLGRLGLGLAGGMSLAAIKKGLDFASDTTLQRNDMSGAQKFNHVMDSLTLGLSKSLREFRNAMDGTTEGMRRAALRLEEGRAAASVRAGNISEINTMRGTAQDAAARAGVYAGASVSAMPSFDRWTMAGQRGYEEYQTTLPAQDAASEAQREAVATRGAERGAAGRYQESQVAYGAARGRRERFQRRDRAIVGQENFTFDRQQLARQSNLVDLQIANDQEKSAFEEMIRRRQELSRAGVSAAEAESRARQANLGVMQAELQVLQQREQRMSGDASRLGGMTAVDRMLGINAVRQEQRYGLENLTPEVRQRLQQFAPEYYQQRATQYGETTSEYREGRRLGAFTGEGTIQGTREEMARLQQSIREGALENLRELTRTVGDTFEQALRGIASALEERVNQVIRDLRNGRNLQNNAQFG